MLPVLLYLPFALPALCQDSGSEVSEYHGTGAELTVVVHDGTGQPTSASAVVKLYRDGATLVRQSQTNRGLALLVVNKLGEYSLVVDEAGYQSAQRDVSLQFSGRSQVDVYLRPIAGSDAITSVPGPPILAPKAQKAVTKALDDIGARKLGDAEKQIAEAVRLAPSHPDVLYVSGVLALEERKWDAAQTALEKATQIDPRHARAFAALGMVFCDQGKYDLAIPPLEKSLQLNPAADWETLWALGKSDYHQGRYDEALKMSQQALDNSSGKAPEIALLVAESLTAAGRYEDAAAVLRAFVKDHGDMREAGTARRWLAQLSSSGKIRNVSN
ncbi:MAG TPA: tetratricopeptide repeat protein [Candidatus Acidoferrum sp.]|nr:tetratricopeptide repeat protein [Candidatus Acidoferrum sp.]